MILDITINTHDPINDLDRAVLAALLGGTESEQKEKAPKPKPERKLEAVEETPSEPVEEPKGEPEDEGTPEPKEDAEGVDTDSDDGATLDRAVALATERVSRGDAAAVKAALAKADAKRVSELSGEGIATFISELEG